VGGCFESPLRISSALSVEPLYPPDLEQPRLILPFMINQIWSYSGGPHGAWERDGAWAAVDFAPGSLVPGCFDTEVYTVAAASGLVVRSENGVVSIDLDGDGREQTGWVLIYLHIAEKGRIPAGSWVERGDLIGHPSCEGGFSTGTHLHLARKYRSITFCDEWLDGACRRASLRRHINSRQPVQTGQPPQPLRITDHSQEHRSVG